MAKGKDKYVSDSVRLCLFQDALAHMVNAEGYVMVRRTGPFTAHVRRTRPYPEVCDEDTHARLAFFTFGAWLLLYGFYIWPFVLIARARWRKDPWIGPLFRFEITPQGTAALTRLRTPST